MNNEERIPLIDIPSDSGNPTRCELIFTWDDISVSRPQERTFMERIRRSPKKPPRAIIQNIFGIARPGEILAIMGASGVGKTTLLNVLIGYEDPTADISEGTICLSGRPTTRSQRLNGSLVGLVEQHEPFIETMLLEEHLIFQAMLRMPRSMSDDDRRTRVKSMMALLSIEKCAKTVINRLSGGERKRLALATVLLVDPPVVLIDEPTSGLDAYLAKSVMDIIRSLATEQRRAIVTVLHQPTSEMYDLMDSLCVITHGGRQSFFGPRKDAADFFALECKLRGSSLDNYIEQLAVPPDNEDSAHQSQMVADCFAQSSYARTIKNEIAKQSYGINNTKQSHFPEDEWNASIWRQFKWLLWRSTMSGARDPVRTVNVILRSIIPAIVLGLMYFHLEYSSKYKQNLNSVSFVTISISLNSCASIVLGTLPLEIKVYIKETRRRIYQTLPYYLVVILRDLPLIILMSTAFTTVVYWVAYINKFFVHFLEFLGITLLTCNACAALSALVSGCSSDVESAVATAFPLLQVFQMFSGFFLYLPSLPRVFIFLSYLSPIYYGFTSVHQLEKKWFAWGLSQQCSQYNQTVTYNSTLIPDLWCEGRDKYESMYASNSVGFEMGMLCILYVAYHTLAYLVIWFRGNRNRIVDYWSKRKKLI